MRNAKYQKVFCSILHFSFVINFHGQMQSLVHKIHLLSSYDAGSSRAKVEMDFPKFGFLRLLHRPVIVRNCDRTSQGPLSSGESQSGDVSGADMRDVMSTFCRPSLKSSLRESAGKPRMLFLPESNACLFLLSDLRLEQHRHQIMLKSSCLMSKIPLFLVWRVNNKLVLQYRRLQSSVFRKIPILHTFSCVHGYQAPCTSSFHFR